MDLEDFTFDDLEEEEESKFKKVKERYKKENNYKEENKRFKKDEVLDKGKREIVKRYIEDKDEELERIEEVLGIEFSEEQRKVITHTGKPLNVLSGAGSGKTTVLVAKMLYREMKYDINPLNMLAITFTHRATKEMENRYYEARRGLGLKRRSRATFKTFHALFLMLLQSMDEYSKVKVLDNNKYRYILSKYVKHSSTEDKMTVLDNMFKLRGKLINSGKSVDGIEKVEQIYNDVNLTNYIKVMEKYKELKESEGVIDFEDMQTIVYNEIINKGNTKPVDSFRRVWGEGDVYIDEYQDISKIQYMIMDELIEDFNRLVVIGDDDQCIYGFRGSEPKYIIDFPYFYEKADRLFLSTNYRCESNILEGIKPSIERNKQRVRKELKSFNKGGLVRAIPLNNSYKPLVEDILNEVEYYEGDMFERISILVRVNYQRMLLSDTLIEYGIPVNISNRNYSLQNNKVYNTLINIIRMIKEEDNQLFLKYGRILFRHLSRDQIKKYMYKETTWYIDIIEQMFYNVMEKDINTIKKIKKTNNMYNALGNVWKLVRGYYKEISNKGYGKYERSEEIVKHMLGISKGLTITEFLSLEKKKYARVCLWEGSREALRIDTIHSVKGLEYDTVYLVGLNNDVIPDENEIKRLSKSRIDDDKSPNEYIEEERRLFYVGWTRAKNHLIISYNKHKPSRFLKEVSFKQT